MFVEIRLIAEVDSEREGSLWPKRIAKVFEDEECLMPLPTIPASPKQQHRAEVLFQELRDEN
jgi:hypothetical protein